MILVTPLAASGAYVRWIGQQNLAQVEAIALIVRFTRDTLLSTATPEEEMRKDDFLTSSLRVWLVIEQPNVRKEIGID